MESDLQFIASQRGTYSSPDGSLPITLPHYWKDENDVTHNLWELSDLELADIGWKGPIETPDPNLSFTHSVMWNSETRDWDLTELTYSEKLLNVNYKEFWKLLTLSDAYNKIKLLSKQSLEVNTVVTEFISLLTDAKLDNNDANVEKIQEGIFDILENITFTDEELKEIEDAYLRSGMFSVYSLTRQPT